MLPSPSGYSAVSMISRIFCISGPYSVAWPTASLKPVNSGGLWLPVIITPPCASRWNREKYSVGVGTIPMSTTSTPVDRMPLISASRKRGELTRVVANADFLAALVDHVGAVSPAQFLHYFVGQVLSLIHI